MGRQVSCTVKFGMRCERADVLLETNELVVRGPLRLKLPFPSLRGVEARGETLVLQTTEGPVAIDVGPDAALWAKKITNPPGRLDKMGIKAGMQVAVVGAVEKDFLSELTARKAVVTRLASTTKRPTSEQDAIVFAAKALPELKRLASLRACLRPAGALWLIRRKGKDATIPEAASRAAAKAAGLVDVKVVAFSETHSAEKLVIPVSQRG